MWMHAETRLAGNARTKALRHGMKLRLLADQIAVATWSALE